MNQEFIDNPLLAAWPFWVLELNPTASLSDLDKAANELLGKLKFGIKEASEFVTPEGMKPRDEFIVREAKSVLQDPKTRLVAEFWYVDPKEVKQSIDSSTNLTTNDWLNKFGVDLWA